MRLPARRGTALQLHAKLGKERAGGLNVLDNDADVVHPLNRHIPEHRSRGRRCDAHSRHRVIERVRLRDERSVIIDAVEQGLA